MPGESEHDGADRPAAFFRVLCVDDQPDVAESTCTLLQLFGFQTRACHDGPTALKVAETFQPGVCILDLNMPGMDGDELAVRLRAQAAGRPLLLIAATAMSDDASLNRVAAAGFHLHLIKPSDPKILLSVLTAHLGRTSVLPLPPISSRRPPFVALP